MDLCRRASFIQRRAASSLPLSSSQTPNSGLRHTSFRRQVPESGVLSVSSSVSSTLPCPFATFLQLRNTPLCAPIPHKSHPSWLNDFRPIALTSVGMKCLERLILRRLLRQTSDQLNPPRCAHRHSIRVEDAIILMLLLWTPRLEFTPTRP